MVNVNSQRIVNLQNTLGLMESVAVDISDFYGERNPQALVDQYCSETNYMATKLFVQHVSGKYCTVLTIGDQRWVPCVLRIQIVLIPVRVDYLCNWFHLHCN